MAEMTGVHVEMGVAVKVGNSELFYPIWSETIAIGGSTSQKAVSDSSLKDLITKGTLIFRIKAQSAGAVYVARGATPDATKATSTGRNSARAHMSASEMRDFPAQLDDKVNCAAAS